MIIKIAMNKDAEARFKEGMALLGHEVEWGLVLEGLKYACAFEVEDGAKEEKKEMPKPKDEATPKRKFFRRSAKADFVGWRKNYPKGGLEVAFETKPDESILILLRANGFKWSPSLGLWWAAWTQLREAILEGRGIPHATDVK